MLWFSFAASTSHVLTYGFTVLHVVYAHTFNWELCKINSDFISYSLAFLQLIPLENILLYTSPGPSPSQPHRAWAQSSGSQSEEPEPSKAEPKLRKPGRAFHRIPQVRWFRLLHPDKEALPLLSVNGHIRLELSVEYGL
ncbi:hypothetical protein EV421DRAFT_1759134 [Armillaria borealis]|uniref:Uncharacterized protein n=1 Tax=Armillaria borealis TaxID=47425 RepID=A0AA39K567_9AGAR|nr:hypothetical protein EV421DRAFT_1759134 [Armillaria borealis]